MNILCMSEVLIDCPSLASKLDNETCFFGTALCDKSLPSDGAVASSK